MRVIEEKNVADFDFWSGAVNNANMLEYEELQQLEYQLEERHPDGITNTQLNDLLWFEFAWCCELIGLEYNEDENKVIRGDGEDE